MLDSLCTRMRKTLVKVYVVGGRDLSVSEVGVHVWCVLGSLLRNAQLWKSQSKRSDDRWVHVAVVTCRWLRAVGHHHHEGPYHQELCRDGRVDWRLPGLEGQIRTENDTRLHRGVGHPETSWFQKVPLWGVWHASRCQLHTVYLLHEMGTQVLYLTSSRKLRAEDAESFKFKACVTFDPQSLNKLRGGISAAIWMMDQNLNWLPRNSAIFVICYVQEGEQRKLLGLQCGQAWGKLPELAPVLTKRYVWLKLKGKLRDWLCPAECCNLSVASSRAIKAEDLAPSRRAERNDPGRRMCGVSLKVSSPQLMELTWTVCRHPTVLRTTYREEGQDGLGMLSERKRLIDSLYATRIHVIATGGSEVLRGTRGEVVSRGTWRLWVLKEEISQDHCAWQITLL